MRTVVGEEARRAQGLALEELSLRNGFLECGLNRGKLGADEGSTFALAGRLVLEETQARAETVSRSAPVVRCSGEERNFLRNGAAVARVACTTSERVASHRELLGGRATQRSKDGAQVCKWQALTHEEGLGVRADGREPEVVWGSSIPTGVVLGTRHSAYDLNSAPVAPDGTVPAEFPVRREGDAVAAEPFKLRAGGARWQGRD